MNLFQTFRVAFRALLRNKLRSFLTALGIIIGVGAVIAMVAIGEGARAQMEATFAAMGTNLLILLPGSVNQSGSRGGFGSGSTLTWDDLRAIQTEAPAVEAAAPVLRTNAPVLSEEQNWTTSVYGTTPTYLVVRNWKVVKGTPLSDSDEESGTKVVLLGQTVSDQLFGPDADPVGRAVRIKNIPFVVQGVLDKKGQSQTGQDFDDMVLIPESTYRAKISSGLANYINGTIYVAADPNAVSRAQDEIEGLLRDRHHLAQSADDDFSIRNLAEMANAQQEGNKTMTTLLASIAAVSLLVGGIGVMNIMLVSVTERTREIGVRMAIGARPLHILAQFLVEALSLAVVGGALGVVLGLTIALRLGAQFGWAVLVRPEVVIGSVLFSGLIGVGFGLYPAMKASRLDPIDALRYE
jgi:putative ABC transport system permease protein